MKVTVCFGSVRVVVPCGSGDLLVQDLIDKAITRYKKAVGKPSDYWVTVHNLKSSSDGGILDPDDQLNDVADDREQIIALYEEQDAPPVPHNGGDGTSASSVGTASPDMFSTGDANSDKGFAPIALRHAHKNDVIITQNDLNTGSNLIVRRGSEPVLTNLVGNVPNDQNDDVSKSNLKRWSAIASIDETKSPRDSEESNTEEEIPVPVRTGGIGQEQWSAFTRFARDSTRQSLASNSSTLQRWIDTQEKREEKYNQVEVSRKEPVGGSGRAEDDDREKVENKKNQLRDRLNTSKNTGTVISLKNSAGPLGIHVVPDYDQDGRDVGLAIQGIEAGGRIYRDGRLQVHDRIVEINGTSLLDVDFSKAQDVFKQALQTNEIMLRVVKNGPPSKQTPPQVFPKPNGKKPKPDLTITVSPSKRDMSSPHKSDERKIAQVLPTKNEDDQNPGSPTKKVPPAIPARHPTTALSSPTKTRFTAPTNTRRIGKKIHIELTKGSEGLGFSITTRDNPAGGNCPIYIKNILPKGAAVKDGKLKSGDRLLEVNAVEMTGKSQSEAVSILRNTKSGSTVSLVVSRQVLETEVSPQDIDSTDMTTPTPPDQSPEKEVSLTEESSQTPGVERFTYDIPLNDCGSAGLGVSVKGKTATNESGTHDLGIFIKSVITGGAASKDGRLKVNDQLIEVNEEVLECLSNAEAMEKLRTAMQKDKPKQGYIHLVIARRKVLGSSGSSASSREVRISQSDAIPDSDKKTSSDDTSDKLLVLSKKDLKEKEVTEVPQARPTSLSVNKTRNPVLERLTGFSNIRNESYQRANNESLNESTDSAGSDKTPATVGNSMPDNNGMTISSPTLNANRGETVLIEGDNYQVQMEKKKESHQGDAESELTYKYGGLGCNYQRQSSSQPRVRPASTLGFTHLPGPDVKLPTVTTAHSNEDLLSDDGGGAPSPPAWLVEWDKAKTDDDMSPRDEDGNLIFQREGFGRQSMSEKRRAHLDPRVSEFYQKLKQGKDKGGDQYYSATWDRKKTTQKVELDEEQGGKCQLPCSGPLRRVGSAESLISHSTYQSPPHDSKTGSVGPMLGLKKSSSLESLQTAVQEAVMDEDGNIWRPHVANRGMVRGRGCNDSFRAAVDRSYDSVGEAETMETLEEEESSESGSMGQGQVTGSARSSFSTSDHTGASNDEKKGKKKNKKEKEEKLKEKDKEKGGLFKGLGHMFRFGRHRKPLEQGSRMSAAELHKEREQDLARQRQDEMERAKARKAAQEEHDRIHEQYRILQEKQQQIEAVKQRENQLRSSTSSGHRAPPGGPDNHHPHPHHTHQHSNTSSISSMDQLPPQNRAERIQQLRAEHQRRHKERQGQYPLDAQEEAYEQQLQEYERQRVLAKEGYRSYPVPPRRPSEDPYDRPPGRLGYTADPNRYSHYQNFHEIQAQLAHHDRYQRMYHHYMTHQNTAPDLRHGGAAPRAVTPDPRSSSPAYDHHQHHHPQQSQHYPRSQSVTDTRQWTAPPQTVVHSVHARPQTPISQLTYHTHHTHPHPHTHSHPQHPKATTVTMLPPQIVVNAPRDSYARDYGHIYGDRRTVYAPEQGYSSLPRRQNDRGQNGMMSGPAQV